MDLRSLDWTLATAVGAVIISIVGLIGQIRSQSRQRELQEGELYRQQSDSWATLAKDWERAVLIASGPTAAVYRGVPKSLALEYENALRFYRDAEVAWLDIQHAASASAEKMEELEQGSQTAQDLLLPYRQAVQRIVAHLARVTGLILENRLELSAAYDAMGPSLLRLGDRVDMLVQEHYANRSECPAPANMERHALRGIDIDQISARIGWGDFLEVARGTAERAVLLADLLKMQAYNLGDLDGAWHPEYEDHPASSLRQADRLSNAWRASRRYGRLRAFRLLLRLAKTGRHAARSTFHRYPRWFYRLRERLQKDAFMVALPYNGWLRLPADIPGARLDAVRAVFHARKAPDVRRPASLVYDSSGNPLEEGDDKLSGLVG